MNGHNKTECYILKRLAKEKHSSLLDPLLRYEENNGIRNWFFFFLIYEWAHKARLLHAAKACKDKHSRLLGPSMGYKEMNCIRNCFVFSLTYKWAQ